MTTPTTVEEAIEQNALRGLSSSANASQSATAHSLSEQIEADRYLASKAAGANGLKGFGLRIQRIKPPGGGG